MPFPQSQLLALSIQYLPLQVFIYYQLSCLYVNLTGIPYCNAARNCEVLCQSSRLFVGNQSVMFFYRLYAHAFCVALTTMICYGIMKGKIHGISTWSLFLIVFLAYCVVTYFIDIHADAAEGLQIAYLLDDNFTETHNTFFNSVMGGRGGPLVQL